MKTQRDFLLAIFDSHEEIGMYWDCYGTSCKSIFESVKLAPWTAPFITINPIEKSRKDANVTCFRNFLVEFDNLSLDEQLKVTAAVPYTTCVWSGGKSYHFIISLQEPCSTRAEYDSLMSRILSRLPDADKTARNPSRLTRLGGGIRDNGKEQSIMEIGSRITRKMLEEWLGPVIEMPPKPKYVRMDQSRRWDLNRYTKQFLASGEDYEGRWNAELFKATLDMFRCNYPPEEIYSKLEAITGHLDKSDRRTIESALRTAASDDRSKLDVAIKSLQH